MATGDPVARRVIFGTYVVPTYSIEGEETAIRHTEFQSSPAGTIGGKGSASVNKDQWGDEWTSMEHPEFNLWEEVADVYWEDFTSNWETAPKGEVTITDSSVATLSSDGSDLAFLYVKNTGGTHNALVALDSGTNYYIIIPPGGSVHLRGDGTQLLCNEVRVKASNSAGTTIEFIIAKE